MLLQHFRILQALYQIVILLGLNFGGSKISLLTEGDQAYQSKLKNTLIFNSFVLCQVSSASHYVECIFLHAEEG